MRIFPNTISENIWKDHLSTYCKTLMDYIPEIQKIIPSKYHSQLPFGLYICPLCLKNYFIETSSGINGNSEFSLDHLPPKSASGRFKIITCKKCNNDSGTFESEIEKVLNFGIDKTDPNEKLKLKVELTDPETGKCIKGVAHNENGETNILFNENLKKHKQEYIDFLNRVNSGKMPRIKIKPILYDSNKLERALVKSAYLLSFAWWGYEFVFSDHGALIRQVIKGEKKYPCQVPISWFEKDKILPTGISILQDGNKRIAFGANIYLRGLNVDATACVLIPSPSKSAWDDISILIKNDEKTYSGITIPRVVHRIGYSISWNIIIPQ
ncbi:MAG: hypothetical protein H6550_02015 [Chitinophagales bacterium]|nr:hypothetical protein [Chitinophagales bacterium]